MSIKIKKIIEIYKYIVRDGQITSWSTELGNNHFISYITVGAPLIDCENHVSVAICENSIGNEEFMFIYLCNTDKWSKKSKEYCSPFMHLYILNKDIKENQMMFEEHLKMGYEIEEKWPNKIKVTSKFANYLDTQCAQLSDKPKKPPKGGIVAQLTGIPIEIDDAIKSEYYKFVY